MFKQPRVPEYRENEGVPKHLRALTLFLKDFSQDVWTHCKNNKGAGSTGDGGGGATDIVFPVTSVNTKTGDVVLSASDVQARPDTWMPTASDVGAADYETKAWTPGLRGESTVGSLTYDAAATSGTFWRLGRLVFIRAYIKVTAINTRPTGNLALAGLPFATIQSAMAYPAATNQWGAAVFQFAPTGKLGATATRIKVGTATINCTDLKATNYAFFGVYQMAVSGEAPPKEEEIG